MGDRVSVSFRNGGEESVTLFSHWGGEAFVANALRYARELEWEVRGSHLNPLDRLEPETVMVDFIRDYTDGEERVRSNLYLGATPADGDNSDNGHFVIVLGDGEPYTCRGGV